MTIEWIGMNTSCPQRKTMKPMNKPIRYSFAILALLAIVFFSLDIRNLGNYKASQEPTQFDAVRYAASFWNDSLPVCIAGAPQIETLLQVLVSEAEVAFREYGRKLGISTSGYFMAKGTGVVDEVGAETLVVKLADGEKVRLATDFIFGNAIRDGSGKVNINTFMNMTDFNAVSVEINKLAKAKVVAPLKSSVVVGMKIEFAATAEICEANTDLHAVLWIPVSLQITDGKHE